jgi:hypothetical protein
VRGFFGSWEISPGSWALLSAVTAALGFAGWLLVRLRPSLRGAAALWLLTLDAAAMAAGAVLFVVAPPFATHPFLGPWLTFAAAVVAGAGCRAAAARRGGRPRTTTAR